VKKMFEDKKLKVYPVIRTKQFETYITAADEDEALDIADGMEDSDFEEGEHEDQIADEEVRDATAEERLEYLMKLPDEEFKTFHEKEALPARIAALLDGEEQEELK
jgi:hypothetical protein